MAAGIPEGYIEKGSPERTLEGVPEGASHRAPQVLRITKAARVGCQVMAGGLQRLLSISR